MPITDESYVTFGIKDPSMQRMTYNPQKNVYEVSKKADSYLKFSISVSKKTPNRTTGSARVSLKGGISNSLK